MAKPTTIQSDESDAKQGIVVLLQALLAHLPEDWYISLGYPGGKQNFSGGHSLPYPDGAAFEATYWLVGYRKEEMDSWFDQILGIFKQGGSAIKLMQVPGDPTKAALISTPGDFGVNLTRGKGALSISVTSPPYPTKTARSAPPMPFDIYRDRVVQN